MKPVLTTICPYWGRPEALGVYLEALRGASIPEVRHLVLFAAGDQGGVTPPSAQFRFVGIVGPPNCSIGYFHDKGVEMAETEWVMKSDVDVLPNVRYYRELLPILQSAEPREWFNGGYLYLKRGFSESSLVENFMPIEEEDYKFVMENKPLLSDKPYREPAGSNFVCRREEYLKLGGSDPRFRGWGWEDYQQLYMLDAYFRGDDPLPGPVNDVNVTQRCRDEISRLRASQLLARNPWLCLLHKWHAATKGDYKRDSEANRSVLLDYILRRRGKI